MLELWVTIFLLVFTGLSQLNFYFWLINNIKVIKKLFQNLTKKKKKKKKKKSCKGLCFSFIILRYDMIDINILHNLSGNIILKRTT